MSDYVFNPAQQWRLPPPGPSPDLHRSQVTNLLLSAGIRVSSNSLQDAPTLAILGAGPCHDIDLHRLLDQFESIQLVDLDHHTLQQGVEQQRVSHHPKLKRLAPFDVTGIDRCLSEFSSLPTGASKQSIAEMFDRIDEFSWGPVDRELDLIASTCLLSQLISQVVESVGEQHENFVELIQRIRRQHLQLMIDHLRVGGLGVIIFDFVSSDTLSRLPHLTGEPLKRALQAAIDQNNFFHGMNPQVIHHVLFSDFQEQTHNLSATPPWVWNAGARCYGVTAFVFEKR